MRTSKQRQHDADVQAARRSRRRQLQRRLEGGELVSCSSDAKWSRVFEELQASLPADAEATVKLVDSEPRAWGRFLSAHFEETHFDATEYWELEWVRLPADRAPAFEVLVDHEHADGWLTLWGYRRPGD